MRSSARAPRGLGGNGRCRCISSACFGESLRDGSDSVRQESSEALSAIGTPAKDPLIAALADSDAKRRAGALALAGLGAAAKDAAPALLASLEKEKDAFVRAAFLTVLPKTSPDPARATPLLVAAAVDQDTVISHAGINALASARSLQEGAVKSLSEMLASPDPSVRPRAAHALGRLGPSAADALPALMKAAASTGDEAFSDAIMQIGRAAMPALLAELKKTGGGSSDWIFHALRGFDRGGSRIDRRYGEWQARGPHSAIRALGSMGLDATPAWHALFTAASEGEPKVRAAALRALVALRAESAHLKPLLESAMADADPDLKKAGAAGMAATGGAKVLGVDGLATLLSDDDPAGRLSAVQALGELGAKGAPAVTALVQHFEEPSLQLAIIETLRRMGPAAAPAVPPLLECEKEWGRAKGNRPARPGRHRTRSSGRPADDPSLP